MAAERTRALARVLLATAGVALVAPSVAAAQSPAASYRSYEHRLVGRVISFEPYHLRLDRGPAIVLHRGTVIHPRGLTLQNGMPVRVYGHIADDGAFSADQIDLLPPSRPPYRAVYTRPY